MKSTGKPSSNGRRRDLYRKYDAGANVHFQQEGKALRQQKERLVMLDVKYNRFLIQLNLFKSLACLRYEMTRSINFFQDEKELRTCHIYTKPRFPKIESFFFLPPPRVQLSAFFLFNQTNKKPCMSPTHVAR